MLPSLAASASTTLCGHSYPSGASLRRNHSGVQLPVTAAGLGLSVLPRIVEDGLRTGALAMGDLARLPAPRVLLVTRAGQRDDPRLPQV